MAEEKLYKILKNASNGWFLIEDRAMNLTKENCDQLLKAYFNSGENPNDIKACLLYTSPSPRDKSQERIAACG